MTNARLLGAALARLGFVIALTQTPPSLAQTYHDSGGTVVQATGQAGSDGKDFSSNQPNLPNIGASFGSASVYANYVLVATVPANPTRFIVDVENTSGAQIAIVRDDGTAAVGATPVNASVFALGPGSGSGAQGGSWSSQTFKGRVQIYAPAPTAQVAVYVD